MKLINYLLFKKKRSYAQEPCMGVGPLIKIKERDPSCLKNKRIPSSAHTNTCMNGKYFS
jgi:hypothetical protein